jgi:hypothetical protein
MADKHGHPLTNSDAPDASNSYERAHPENESGMGRLDNNKFVPADRADSMKSTISHAQDPTHQLNSEDVIDQRSTAAEQPDHSMKGEAPMGWDMAPQEAKPTQQRRHPRTEGKGGTP